MTDAKDRVITGDKPIVVIDGARFGGAPAALVYLRDRVGFTVKEAAEYVRLLPRTTE